MHSVYLDGKDLMAGGSNAAECKCTRGNSIGWGISLAFEMSVSWSWIITEAIPNSKIEAGKKLGIAAA